MKRRRPPTPSEVAAIRALDLNAPLPSPNSDVERQRGYGAAADTGPESDSTSGPSRDESPCSCSARPVSQTDTP